MSLKDYLEEFFNQHKSDIINAAVASVKLNSGNFDKTVEVLAVQIMIEIPIPTDVLPKQPVRRTRKKQYA